MKHFTEKTGAAFLACAAAALRGDSAFVKRETERSVSLDDTDDRGRSLLHYAVEGGSPELVTYLVTACQMDPLWADQALITPYDLSYRQMQNGRPEIYDFLKEKTGFGLEESYRNPVCPSMHPDPSIVRVGDDFYMANSSFVFFPGLPISRSTDLVHWDTIGHAFENPAWAEELLLPLDGGRGFWAPDISYIDGKFVVVATLRNNDDMPYPQTQALMTADRPEGPWSKPVIFNQDGIDPSLFVDDDGKKYMLLNRGARLIPLSDDLTEMTGKPVMIAYGAAGAIPEGPHLFKKDGFYYLLLAEGGTGKGHRATVLRSEKLYGPYEKSPYYPLITQPDPAGALQCCGHADIVETADGRWFIVYLCSRLIDGQWGMLGRETCLDEVVWTADGWPRLKYGPGPSVLAPLPLPEAKKERFSLRQSDDQAGMCNNYSARESWNGGQDAAGKRSTYGNDPDRYGTWFSPRTIDRRYISIENNESAFITGSGRDLTDRNPGSLLLKHQRDFAETDTFVLHPLAAGDGDEAGVTLYYDENSFIKFGLRKAGKKEEIFVCEYADDEYVREEAFMRQTAGGAVTLTVETDGLRRSFFADGKEICTWHDVTGICSEGLKKGKRFTGACVGIFVCGKGRYRFEETKR